MNQGRVWCVVHPTVGLPLLLGSVAVTSLIVHASVMTHTTWMSSYWQGALRNRPVVENAAPAVAPAALASAIPAAPGFTVSVAPLAAPGKAGTAFVVTISPNPAAATASADAAAEKPPAITTANSE